MAERKTITVSVTIDRPPAEVFAYLSDVSKHAEWSPKPFRVEGTSGPVKTGDTFATVGRIPGDKNHRNEVTVTECSAPTRLVLDSLEKSEHFVNTFELAPSNGGTTVTKSTNAPKPGFPLSVVFPLLLAGLIRPDLQKGLNNLKAKLESS